jgi:hypothetical protein
MEYKQYMEPYHHSIEFLRDAMKNAAKNGYDPTKLSIAKDGIHKLVYETSDGKMVKFGRLGYGDYLFYKRYAPEIAEKKRKVFRRSHGAISIIHKLDKYSANELSIGVLW